MGNNSSVCPDIGLLRCDCGYQHKDRHVDGDGTQPPPPRQRLPPPPSDPRPRLPPPRFGKLITMLSIDGGGIRGLIPAVVLGRLEEKLQAADGDNKNARIADYFDVIAGTSTGVLIAAMLVTPDGNGRPKSNVKKIETFYKDNGPEIFTPNPKRHRWWCWGPLVHLVRGPKYDGTFLHRKIREVTGSTTMDKTLSKLVVPTFDVHRLEPIIVSSFVEKHRTETGIKEEIKPLVSDVCIGTSAAPTYFPAHHFEHLRFDDSTDPAHGHLIDGGMAANNPTMAAIMSVTREQLLAKDEDSHRRGLVGNEDFGTVDYKKYLVISIGTGSTEKARGEYTAEDCAKWSDLKWEYTAEGCAKWSDLKWVSNGGNNPIIDIFSKASDVLVDIQVRNLLHNTDKPNDKQNYLRIQAQPPLFLGGMLPPMDDVTEGNMEDLVRIGNDLLDQKLAMMSLYSGKYATVENGPSNDDELERFAQSLVAERNLRLIRAQEEEKKKKATADHAQEATKASTSSPPPSTSSAEATTSISPAARS